MVVDEITFKEYLYEEKKLRDLLRNGEITSAVHDLRIRHSLRTLIFKQPTSHRFAGIEVHRHHGLSRAS